MLYGLDTDGVITRPTLKQQQQDLHTVLVCFLI
jgi:hypothetical protein